MVVGVSVEVRKGDLGCWGVFCELCWGMGDNDCECRSMVDMSEIGGG